MIARRPSICLLLAAVLVVGQWLVAGHDRDHSKQAAAAHVCVACANLDHGSGTPLVLMQRQTTGLIDHQDFIATAAPSSAKAQTHSIRGPPTFLS